MLTQFFLNVHCVNHINFFISSHWNKKFHLCTTFSTRKETSRQVHIVSENQQTSSLQLIWSHKNLVTSSKFDFLGCRCEGWNSDCYFACMHFIYWFCLNTSFSYQVMTNLRLSWPNLFISINTETLQQGGMQAEVRGLQALGSASRVKEDYLSVKLKPILRFNSPSFAFIE